MYTHTGGGLQNVQYSCCFPGQRRCSCVPHLSTRDNRSLSDHICSSISHCGVVLQRLHSNKKKKKANIYCELVLSLNYTLYLTLSVCVSSKRVEFIVWSLTWLERMGSFPPPSHCALVNTPLWAQRGLYGRLNSPVKAPEQRFAFSVESRGPFRIRSLTCKNSLGMLGSSHKGPIHW